MLRVTFRKAWNTCTPAPLLSQKKALSLPEAEVADETSYT